MTRKQTEIQTCTSGLKLVRSSELAPILIRGGSPVSCLRLSNALETKVLGVNVPAQDVQRSCSMENENKDGDMLGAVGGAETGIDTLSAKARLHSKAKVKRRRDMNDDVVVLKEGRRRRRSKRLTTSAWKRRI
jgi:hypothetical protein